MNHDTSKWPAPSGTWWARTKRPEVAVRLIICAVIGTVYAASFFLPVSSHNEWFPPWCGNGFGAWGIPCHPYPPVGAEVFSSFLSHLIPQRMDPSPLNILLNWFFSGFVVWFANPALWLGTVLLAAGRWRGAAISGVVALVLAIAAAFYYFLWAGAGDLWALFELRFGYYLWLASMALLAFAWALRAPEPQKLTEEAWRSIEGLNPRPARRRAELR